MKFIFIFLKILILITLMWGGFLIWKSDLRERKYYFFKNRVLVSVAFIFIGLFLFLLIWQTRLHFFLSSEEYIKNKRAYDLHTLFAEAITVKGGIYDRHHNVKTQLAKYGRDRKNGKIIRDYPLGEATAHLLGYSEFTRDRSGLEKAYFDRLMGQSTGSFKELYNYILNNWFRLNPVGNDVILTIDADLQKEAYRQLRQINRRGAVVVLMPATGEILAMVSYPSFDPSKVDEDDYWQRLIKDTDDAPLYNRAIKGRYPPGSTFKVIVTLAALEQDMQPRFVCSKDGLGFRGYRKRLLDHADEVHGKIDLSKALKVSCNQYFAQLGNRLTAAKIEEMANKMGFNQQLEWNSDSKEFNRDFRILQSIYPAAAKLDSFRTAWSSIGQDEVLVTPMHMALIAAAIANNGKMPKPCIELDRWSQSYSKAFSSSTARKLKRMMQGVLEKEGTAYAARVPGLAIAGKTGTAEVSHGRPHAWFISFAPADKAKIAMAVICENSGYGGAVAAPIAKKLYEKAIELGYLKKNL